MLLGLGEVRGQEAEPKMTEYFVFLTSGKSAADVPKADLQKKQAAHLENFGALAKQGKLNLAGPLGDPKKFLRGVIMVKAPDDKTMAAYFDADPYVKEGFMNLEAHPISQRIGEPKVLLKVEGMDELRMIVFDYVETDPAKRSIPDKIMTEHIQYWEELEKTGRVGLICRFVKNDPRIGIAIVDSIPDAQIEELLRSDPLVANKIATYQLMPQYIGKGVLSFPARK
jgi:uncharacterized protein YciI